MSLLSRACIVTLAGSAACTNGPTCAFEITFCNQTQITLQSPKNTWAPGAYKLTLTADGATKECSLEIPSPAQGLCSSADTTVTLTPICPRSPTVCNNTGCAESVSSANCLPDQFQIDVVSPLATRVVLDLKVDGRTLVNETLTPKVTTEPASSCGGMCTNASATVALEHE